MQYIILYRILLNNNSLIYNFNIICNNYEIDITILPEKLGTREVKYPAQVDDIYPGVSQPNAFL
jgi:hypothetical protein